MSNGNMPAMPVTEERIGLTGDRIITTRGGLTKREHFAGLAMAAMASNTELPDAVVAAYACNLADALLAELDKEAT